MSRKYYEKKRKNKENEVKKRKLVQNIMRKRKNKEREMK